MILRIDGAEREDEAARVRKEDKHYRGRDHHR
jgi:hypothetical protein